MDIVPDRLFLSPAGTNCQNVTTSPSYQACLPNNVAWSNLMSELGYVDDPALRLGLLDSQLMNTAVAALERD